MFVIHDLSGQAHFSYSYPNKISFEGGKSSEQGVVIYSYTRTKINKKLH